MFPFIPLWVKTIQKKYSKKFLWIFIFLFCILLISASIFFGQKANSKITLADETTQKDSLTLNKTFSFPVNNSQGQEVTSIAYTLISADKQNQVIVKGQKAEAVLGRTFFIISLKLTNTSSQPIQLTSRDYIRISVGRSSELLAADLYNDPILVQPISTEYTRLGFPIDASENHIVLHIGQLNGPKTEIPIAFK